MAKLQAKTKEQQEFVRSILTDVACWAGTINEDRVEIDGWVDFDQMAEIVGYLRGEQVKTYYKLVAHYIGIDDYGYKQRHTIRRTFRTQEELNVFIKETQEYYIIVGHNETCKLSLADYEIYRIIETKEKIL